MSITATIIAYNEAENIQACIDSVRPVCAEVVVIVDNKTTDATAAIAEAAGAVLIYSDYLGDGPQKALGAQHARHDWVLSIDADERLEADAVAAILALDLEHTEVDAYSLHRRNFVDRHWIRAAGFYPDDVVRLYHKGRAAYLPKKGHSSVAAKKIVALDAHLSHFTYRDYRHWVERINALSSRDAWAMYDRGRGPSRSAPTLHALTALLRKLIFKGGLFQGQDGMTVAVTTAFHAYMKYLKLNELHEQKAREKQDT